MDGTRQLNLLVATHCERLLRALDHAAVQTGRAKNELVLEALETYLTHSVPELGTFHLGEENRPSRDDLQIDDRGQ